MLSCAFFFFFSIFLFFQSFLARLLHHSQTLTASHTQTHSTRPIIMSRIILSTHSSNMYPAEYFPPHSNSFVFKADKTDRDCLDEGRRNCPPTHL